MNTPTPAERKRRILRRRTLLTLLLAWNLHTVAAAAEPATPTEVFRPGDFALRVPARGEISGIFVALGGPDTRAFVTDGVFGAPLPELEASLQVLAKELRMLADDRDLAMLGTSLHGARALPNHPASDQLIFNAIREAADLSGHQELISAPLFLYGISGGSLQAAGFTARHPRRVGALLLKVPGTPQRLDRAEALAVPTYLILAEHDTLSDNRAILAVFSFNRRAGALWAAAVEPGLPHHSLSPSHRALTLNWLSTVIGLRLDPSGKDGLRPLPESGGWLGHPEFGVTDWAGLPEKRRAASWFPSRATAEEWQEFIRAENPR